MCLIVVAHCFTEVPTSVFGDKLRAQVEERLSFYETGEVPRKNVDVMKEAVKEVSSQKMTLSKLGVTEQDVNQLYPISLSLL